MNFALFLNKSLKCHFLVVWFAAYCDKIQYIGCNLNSGVARGPKWLSCPPQKKKILALLNFGKILNQGMPEMRLFWKKMQKLPSPDTLFHILNCYYKLFNMHFQIPFDYYRHLQK